MAGAMEKAEAELLGRWAVLARKLRRSYWGGGLVWRESGEGVTGEVGGNLGESRGGVTGEVGWAGVKAEAELLGRWACLGRRQRSLPGHKASLSMVGAAKMAPGVAAVLLQGWTLSARQETQEEEKVWGSTTSEMLRAQGRRLA